MSDFEKRQEKIAKRQAVSNTFGKIAKGGLLVSVISFIAGIGYNIWWDREEEKERRNKSNNN
jgi:hypothetical protein